MSESIAESDVTVPCRICGTQVPKNGASGTNNPRFDCRACGTYRLSEYAAQHLREATGAAYGQTNLIPDHHGGIDPALRATGYRPVRIDRVEHNEKIDDRIIAAIRQSGLLVADFTGNRSGVYFEAGFAMGLGIPVIWMCRRDYLDAVHFDTRQYNHIVWEDPADLRERLQLRIEATLPTFPPVPESVAID